MELNDLIVLFEPARPRGGHGVLMFRRMLRRGMMLIFCLKNRGVERTRRLARNGVGGCFQRPRKTVEQACQCFMQILDQMEAIGNLLGSRRPRGRSLGVDSAPVAADDPDAGVVFQPSCQLICGSVGQQIQGPMPFQITQDCSISPSLMPRPVIHAQYSRLGRIRKGLRADQTQDRIRARGHGERMSNACAGLAAQCHPHQS